MRTKLFKLNSGRPSRRAISAAARVIKRGGLVAFPTETVYGLGASAFNARAVRRIFHAKGRPMDNPLIVHISSISSLRRVVRKIPSDARKIMEKFWPGPLTLVFEKSPLVPDEVTAGLRSVGVRMPANKVALTLIRAAGPIAAPSANLSGRPSPTNAKDVMQDLRGKVDVVLDAGPSRVGIESTVVDLSSMTVLRPGGVTFEELKRVIPSIKLFGGLKNTKKIFPKHPPSPGMKYRHYAPKARLILFEGNSSDGMLQKWKTRYQKAAVLCTLETALDKRLSKDIFLLGSRKRPDIIARNLFYNLRRIDRLGYDLVLAEGIDERGMGLAVMNRLRRAASRIIKK